MNRTAKIKRKTKETKISIDLNLDDYAQREINTGIGFFDHLLDQFSLHGRFGVIIKATGDTHIDDHHLVEDTGIALGLAFKEALGDRTGIVRYGSARLPMDETLITADIDLTTRTYLHYAINPKREFLKDFDTSLPLEFWRSFVHNCGLNLHIEQIRGENAHHILEGSFKAVAIALRQAKSFDPSLDSKSVSSSKGVL